MQLQSKWFRALLTLSFVLAFTVAWQTAAAEDVVHAVSGVVKSVDKASKTMVVKAGDGTEHTIKWTDKTTVKGAKDAAKGTEAGAKDVAKGTDAGAKDAAKGTKAGTMDTYDGLKEGSKVSVKYTEKGGEKTAVAVKDASKATAKAIAQ